MKANAVCFEAPTPKVYDKLPPPIEEIEEVLAILFIGAVGPTNDDFARTPLLVRRNVVINALEWLKVNHVDYKDVELSHNNLLQYSETMPPCAITFNQSTIDRPESAPVFDMPEADGTEDGMCAFAIHGVTGDHLEKLTKVEIDGIALRHFNSGGKVLAVGHKDEPESLWKNPQLYPKMFPWLFPYGHGGLGTTPLSETAHKKWLLMYHDKRFQKDENFPVVAFSHKQVKSATQAGWLLADKASFEPISQRLMNLDERVMRNVADRMASGERVVPTSEAEKACFKVLTDLDRVAGKVSGSTTTKKYMRNEVWALISHRGAPSWYITVSPADSQSPISLYYADGDEECTLAMPCLNSDQRIRLICENPVAAARFFNFMVTVLLEDILGYKSEHRGLYGEHVGHYGVVEQQGRLTLHLHLLLWIRGALSPQEIRERLLNGNKVFKEKLITYLESVFAGEFMTGSEDEVKAHLDRCELNPEYEKPTLTLPVPPPPLCSMHPSTEMSMACEACGAYLKWHEKYEGTVDDILLRSNSHKCPDRSSLKELRKLKHANKTCNDNKYGICRARFPRSLHPTTEVDPETGAIIMKKHEAMYNTFSYPLTYIFRSNTDVTYLGSGTAVKSVVLYVTDYITKASLATHVVFDTIVSVFSKNASLVNSTSPNSGDNARKLMTKIVNVLSTKMELGAPMICAYLLGHPDHYTDHHFIPFYWQQYVNEVRSCCHPEENLNGNHKVALLKRGKRVVGLSPVDDYVYCPVEGADISLYDWIRISTRVPLRKTRKRKTRHDIGDTDEDGGDTLSIDDDVAGDVNPKDSCAASQSLPANHYRFLPGHKLSDTHGLHLRKDSVKRVVNFVGANIPRRDKGDYDYYCCTMLSLFKPWRKGTDLMEGYNSWAEAFNAFAFTPRQKQMMNNFMIRYECLDARDDYRSQMLKDVALKSSWDPFMDAVLEKDEGEPDTVFAGNDDDADVPQLPNVSKDPLPSQLDRGLSSSYLASQKMKAEIRRLLSSVGWSRAYDKNEPHCAVSVDTEVDCNTSMTSLGCADPMLPPPTLPRHHWTNLVSEKRKEVLALRSSKIPPSVRNAFIEERARRKLGVPPSSNNLVKVVDQNFFQKDFHAGEKQRYADSAVKKFQLNEEQERAFRIIASHASLPSPEALSMYIGGMGGTGKSTVLKALMYFFAERNENHRLTVVAPTGNAAALLGGSTYHSTFGINNGVAERGDSLPTVRERLMGVQYVFFDEVSMLSAREMYRISKQLCRAWFHDDKVFGGLNMIFAGDFAQLPPARGGEAIFLYGRKIGTNKRSQVQQEMAMGKALWHHVTTVVILRQNMRQRMQTINDCRFRRALENMRYKNCSPDDIAFLNSRVTSPILNAPNISSSSFRNVAIITAKNAQKDLINDIGAERFAKENGKPLHHFYCEDSVQAKKTEFGNEDWVEEPRAGSRRKTLRLREITKEWKEYLWTLDASAADTKVPAKISLCEGMPVIIRRNIATELCITRGQEGTVYGWTARGPLDRQVLDTLFVRLTNPPTEVKLDGLPLNVVPITPVTTPTKVSLPNHYDIPLQRTIVNVIPCFSMTDYASQGKTRTKNAVHLNNCNDFHGYYTALSRSSTAECTVILQNFDPRKITGGLKGIHTSLRQEYRELELLDEITKLSEVMLAMTTSLHECIPRCGGHRMIH
ncbi:hypothetical protein MPER_13236 [Moniliophthora perniciosa FA553]|nr:hypothetical protein MPER_13236 [Moniliophthora perniciosa FA553]